MAKGPLVTEQIEVLIASVYRKHPKRKAPAVRNEVDYFLRQDNPKLPAGYPSLSTVQKVLALVRRKAKELPDNPQERPWSTASLDNKDNYYTPPEALPVVLKVWKSLIEKNISLTIREAKWVSRLSWVITDMGQLTETARRYALMEFLYDSINRPFNSRGLDKSLMGIPFDAWDPFEPRHSDLPPNIDKDGEVIDFSRPDAKERFQAKRKGGTK